VGNLADMFVDVRFAEFDEFRRLVDCQDRHLKNLPILYSNSNLHIDKQMLLLRIYHI